MTGGSAAGGVADESSGAGVTMDEGGGELGSGVGVVVAAAGGRALGVLADFAPGACQPGMINSIPGRIFAGSEMLFAVAISPTFTWYLRAIAPSVSPARTTCLTDSPEVRAAGAGVAAAGFDATGSGADA